MPTIGIEDLLEPADVCVGLRAPDKRRLLEDFASRAGQALSIPAKPTGDALIAIEERGSTALHRTRS